MKAFDPTLAAVTERSRKKIAYQLSKIERKVGRELMRRDERTASIPVLALTAQAMQGDRERFLAAGFDGYVSKPVNIVELVDTVKQHCDGGSR